MTSEEQLIQRCFEAFNGHDLEGVVARFHDQAVLVNSRLAEVPRSNETEFALLPVAHRGAGHTGNNGQG
jgi:hypothetical protein